MVQDTSRLTCSLRVIQKNRLREQSALQQATKDALSESVLDDLFE